MTNQDEKKIVEKIKSHYESNSQENSRLQQLKDLDKKVKMPAWIFAYVYGILGTLILGTGMCLAMCVFGQSISTVVSMSVGISVGIVGIIMVATTYVIFKKLLSKRKEKYSQEIIAKSNELLNQ